MPSSNPIYISAELKRNEGGNDERRSKKRNWSVFNECTDFMRALIKKFLRPQCRSISFI
jgi:hypothetical protein